MATPRDKEQETSAALAELCRIYLAADFCFHLPTWSFDSGRRGPHAGFLCDDTEGDWLQNADPSRGRFRSLLLKSLKNFLNDAADKIHARKRGGDVKLHFVGRPGWLRRRRNCRCQRRALHSLPPERLFDVRWAATVVERALRRLREECERKGRWRVFDVLSAYLTVERDDVSSASLSTTLAVPQIR